MRLAVLVLLSLVLAMAGCSSSGPHGVASAHAGVKSIPFGADPLVIAKTLKICDAPTSYSPTIALCTFSDGRVIISSVKDAASQSYAGSVADSSSNGCNLIGTGFELQAPTTVLASHVDVPTLQAGYGAELHGQCAQ